MRYCFTSLLFFISFHTIAQTEKTFRTFLSTSSGYSYQNDFSQSVEVGRWGNTTPLSYSLLFFGTTNTVSRQGWDYYIGIKPYYTFAEPKGTPFSFMTYALPELRLNKKNIFQMEEGVVMNYKLSNNFILSYTFSIQHSRGSSGSPGLSLCLNYLFN